MNNETSRIETIKVSKEFKGIMGGVWLGMEAEVVVSTDEDVINEFRKRNELLEKTFMALNPQINWGNDGWTAPRQVANMNSVSTEPTPDPIQAFKDLINSKYQNKKTLENLKEKVQALNNPEVTEIFNNRLKSFE